MLSFLKKKIQLFNTPLSLQEQSRLNAENEYLVMSCGSLNPRFLAKIKRCKGEYQQP
ncbi:MAG: hypothetical protein PVG45_01230 [Gammaproteobacteria bacterium]